MQMDSLPTNAFQLGSTFNEREKIWYGPTEEQSLFHPDSTIGRVLFDIMTLHGNSVAQVSDTENTSVTYDELRKGATRIAQSLKKMELAQDDIVGIVADHTTLTMHVVLGCWFNATVFHAVNPAHEVVVIERLFGITLPKLIFCEGQYFEKVRQAREELQLNIPIYTINNHIKGELSLEELMKETGTEHLYRPTNLVNGGDQTCCILNSSGTTGLPKAVCISNHVFVRILNIFTPLEIILSFSPLDWLSSISIIASSILAGGKRIISKRQLDPEYFADLVEKHKVTLAIVMPSFAARLVNFLGTEHRDFSHLQKLIVVGGILPSSVQTKLLHLLKKQLIINGYTTTEIGCNVAGNIHSDKPGTVGLLAAGLKIKIVSDKGQQLGIGQIGEILVHHGKKWNGYYDNPEETSKMLDADNWFVTGDLGYFDEEGYLFIVDRKKDVMKYRGMHYSPNEIEEVILALPDVVEVCVFGNTNETEGDRPAAAIVKRPGSELTELEVVQHVAAKSEVEWKRLHGGVFFIDSLAKSLRGKVLRRETKNFVQSKFDLP